MPVPTDEQVKEYAQKLPQIYRDIFAAFPGMARFRRAGDGLSVESIEEYMVDQCHAGYRIEDVEVCLQRLVDGDFLSRHDRLPFLSPTELGERLIVAITGRHPEPAIVPELPEPTWG